jgi:hypothetical protein
MYKPLDNDKHQIRLLHLNPGSFQDEPSCSLSTTSLDDTHSFEALSYVWGDLGDLVSITLHDESFEVTKNLRTALTYLRYEDRERSIWIDALCINQKDLIEKNAQLPLMSEIYSKAACVIIFLGEDEDGWATAKDYMTTMVNNPSLHLDPLKEPHVELTGGIKWRDPKLTRALAQFYSRPWWHRVWTVQEFVLAQDFVIQVGLHLLTKKFLEDYGRAHRSHTLGCCYESTKSLLDFDLENATIMNFGMQNFEDRNDVRERRDTVPFSEIFLRYQDRQCYNPRDKIYGMLGLASKDIIELVQPNYEDDINIVYEKTTVAMIRKYATLDIFSQIIDACSEARLPGLPSWVPDWSTNADSRTWSAYIIRTARNYNYDASDGRPAALRRIAPGVCATPAVLLDPAAALGESNRLGNAVPASWAACAWADESNYLGMEATPRALAFLQTVCGGTPRLEGGRFVRVPDGEADARMMEDWVAGKRDGLDEMSKGYADAVGTATWGRRVFRSERGFVGLAPGSAREGDWVVVLPGGKVPFLVRGDRDAVDPEDQGRKCYRIIGDGYVHGIMDGSAFTFVERGYCEMKDILLV